MPAGSELMIVFSKGKWVTYCFEGLMKFQKDQYSIRKLMVEIQPNHINHFGCFTSFAVYLPQHCLYFLPLPHVHGSLRPTFFSITTVSGGFRS